MTLFALPEVGVTFTVQHLNESSCIDASVTDILSNNNSQCGAHIQQTASAKLTFDRSLANSFNKIINNDSFRACSGHSDSDK